MEAPDQISFEQEIYRKIIHLFTLAIPILYAYETRLDMLLIMAPLSAIFITLDFLRVRTKEIADLAQKIFGRMFRQDEKNDLSGASYTLIAACILIALMPKNVAIASIAVPAVGDVMAGLVGRKYGRMKFFNKSVEGTLAFIFSGTVVIYILMNLMGLDLLFFVTGFVAVCIAAVVEASSKVIHIDDNLAVPLAMGFFMGVLL